MCVCVYIGGVGTIGFGPSCAAVGRELQGNNGGRRATIAGLSYLLCSSEVINPSLTRFAPALSIITISKRRVRGEKGKLPLQTNKTSVSFSKRRKQRGQTQLLSHIYGIFAFVQCSCLKKKSVKEFLIRL